MDGRRNLHSHYRTLAFALHTKHADDIVYLALQLGDSDPGRLAAARRELVQVPHRVPGGVLEAAVIS